MTRLSDKLEPVDLIALTIIVGCLTSMIITGNTSFKDVLLTIAGFYFGRQDKKKQP